MDVLPPVVRFFVIRYGYIKNSRRVMVLTSAGLALKDYEEKTREAWVRCMTAGKVLRCTPGVTPCAFRQAFSDMTRPTLVADSPTDFWFKVGKDNDTRLSANTHASARARTVSESRRSTWVKLARQHVQQSTGHACAYKYAYE